jgi:hypothetical protein
MFKIIDHVRIRLTALTESERSASAFATTTAAGSFFDEELARLRWRWVESHRAFNCGPASEREQAMLAAHASADAYFERLNRLKSGEHLIASLPRQVYAELH